MTDLLLGVDLGTGSSKAVLVTPDGVVEASATRPHRISMPRYGWAEVDAEQTWWGDTVALCRELLADVDASRVRGVCVSGVGPCLLLCDAQLRPLRPAILYGIDTRARAEVDELTQRYGRERMVARGGSALSSQAVGPKLLWARRHEPEAWAQTAGWYNSNSFVAGRLTGEYVLDHHTASQCDPLYELAEHAWNTEWADEVAPGVPLPRLAWPSEVIGTVTADAAAQTGLAPGTPVSAGTVDAWAEAFSVGVRQPGDLMLMYGSTAFLVQVQDGLRTNGELWSTAYADPGVFTYAAGTSTAGSLINWMREVTGTVPFETLVAEARLTPPGADGLLMLPYFAGERTPIYDPQARGMLAGLTLHHTRGHLFRAANEGIALGLRQIFDVFDTAGGEPKRIVAVGGGTKGGLLMQIVSDVAGREQQLPELTIGASYGDALLAAIGTGTVPPETDWTRLGDVVAPRPEAHERYEELYPAYRALYADNRDLVHQLAAIQERGPARSG